MLPMMFGLLMNIYLVEAQLDVDLETGRVGGNCLWRAIEIFLVPGRRKWRNWKRLPCRLVDSSAVTPIASQQYD